MKNQELKSSLIKSGIVLALCIFFIYAFAVSDSGGVAGTIASLFSGVVFLIGLALAVVVSVAVMIGIYFGILAMYSQEVCSKTYDQFKPVLRQFLASMTSFFSSKCCATSESTQPDTESEIETLRDKQNVLNNQLTQIKNSVNSVQENIATLSSSINVVAEENTSLDSKTKTIEEDLASKASAADVDDSLKKISNDLNTIQNSVTPLTKKITELESAMAAQEKEEDGEDVQEIVNKAMSSLQEEITSVKASIKDLTGASKKEEAPKKSVHRILTYFATKEDQDQFTTLVNEAVAKEMTYAEIGELLSNSLSKENAEIIADHPSLTKDFIRICRQKK